MWNEASVLFQYEADETVQSVAITEHELKDFESHTLELDCQFRIFRYYAQIYEMLAIQLHECWVPRHGARLLTLYPIPSQSIRFIPQSIRFMRASNPL